MRNQRVPRVPDRCTKKETIKKAMKQLGIPTREMNVGNIPKLCLRVLNIPVSRKIWSDSRAPLDGPAPGAFAKFYSPFIRF